MNKELLTKALLLLTTVFFSLNSFAQLPAFTVTATPTPQTCLGNGELAFTLAGTSPGSSIDYTVYLLPDLVNPVAVVTSPQLGSLTAGTYQIVAEQTLGNQSNTATTTATITDETEAIAFAMVQTPVKCGNDGVITVNVTQGFPEFYEILSGPVTRPIQASNVFEDLPAGTYQVRVHDICGDALVITMQVTQVNPSLVLVPVVMPGGELPSCNTIFVRHFFSASAGTQVFFPVTFEFTVFPPGGGTPTVVTQTYTGGTPPYVFDAEIPFYYNQQYTYNLTATDACGNVYTRNNNVVNEQLEVSHMSLLENCTDFSFTFGVNNFTGPFTISFTEAPVGFVPADVNGMHPTFNDPTETTYGEVGNPVLEGDYTILLTDACGRTKTYSFEITAPEISPLISTEVANCTSTTGTVSISFDNRDVASVIITAANNYNEPLPDDVSSFISGNGEFSMSNLPLGTYTFLITDECGIEYTEQVILAPEGGVLTLTSTQRAGCEIGEGSIRITASAGEIDTAEIISAPSSYSGPTDITSFIATNGMLYMNSLPAGSYTFEATDPCGGIGTLTVEIIGYQMQVNTHEINPLCGAFDITINHTSNGTALQSFWLQKQNEATGEWEHPLTGIDYNPAVQVLPTTSNSLQLANNATTINIPASGHFRVVKAFHVYSNGSALNYACAHVLHEFDFNPELEIIGAFGFPCSNNSTEVLLDANGVEPLSYAIVDAGGTVLVNNGTSNTFPGLAPGTYIFRVSDECGNTLNHQLNVNELAPLEIEGVNLCEGEDGLLFVTQFSFLNYEWYEESDPGTVLSTTGQLPLTPFDSSIHPGNYHVRITSVNATSCIDTVLDYEVSPNAVANAGEDGTADYCNAGEVLDLSVYLTNPHDEGGVWTDNNGTGALSGSNFSTAGLAAGTYEFTYNVNGQCDTTDTATIILEVKNMPASPSLVAVNAVCEGESIQLGTTAIADAYQWTGPDNFMSNLQNPEIPVTTLAATGNYTLVVTVNGCTSPAASLPVIINPLPEFILEGTTTLCEGQSGGLSVTANSFDAIEWYLDGVLQDGITSSEIEIFDTGIYTAVISNNGCVNEESLTVTENTEAFEVVLNSGCRDFDYYVWVVNQEELGDVTYFWTGPSGFTAAGPEINITDGAAGDYSVEVVSNDGCAVVESHNVENTRCWIPKGISPGDADFNNDFDLSNLDVQHLKIFNRYGLEVYEKENYSNEWHGQSDKGELPTGTYYYVVTLSAGKRLTGWVYLQRAIN